MDRNEAIKIVKSHYPANKQMLNEALEFLIPELTESEDEKIRKVLIELVKCNEGNGYKLLNNVPTSSMIAWLEKQGDIDKASYEIAEKEKYDFVSGQFIECRKSFNEFKEDNSYWFEYVGDDNYIGRSDNILNQKFHITPRQLFTLFTQQHCYKEDSNVNDETNAPTEYGKYVDECLYEASKHFFSDGEDKYSVADLFYAGVRCGKSWFEKQDELKSADKVEPKFKVGDWITNGDYTWKIIKVEPLDYILQSQDGNIVDDTISHVDEQFHSFTIEDAKEGDVLSYVTDEGDLWIMIYWSLYEPYEGHVHYHALLVNDNFSNKGTCCICINDLKPATKEQCDLLFQKMKEAGYEWDAEKKELKKIKQEHILEWNAEKKELKMIHVIFFL